MPASIGRGTVFCRNVNERHAAQESKSFLIGELRHRVRSIMAIVQAIFEVISPGTITITDRAWRQPPVNAVAPSGISSTVWWGNGECLGRGTISRRVLLIPDQRRAAGKTLLLNA